MRPGAMTCCCDSFGRALSVVGGAHRPLDRCVQLLGFQLGNIGRLRLLSLLRFFLGFGLVYQREVQVETVPIL